MTGKISRTLVAVGSAIVVMVPLRGPVGAQPSRTDTTETVWVIFHAKQGQESRLRDLLHDSWRLYLRKHMVVMERPHVVGEGQEDGGKYFFELLTWKSPDERSIAYARTCNGFSNTRPESAMEGGKQKSVDY